MVAVSSTLGAISAGLSVASTVAGAANAKQQADYEASVKQQQADQARAEAAERERDFRRDQEQIMGQYRAAAGAGGTKLNTGSMMLAFSDFAGETELQAERIRKGGKRTATRLEQSAEMSRKAGRNALIGGFGRSGATLLKGYGDYKDATTSKTAYSG